MIEKPNGFENRENSQNVYKNKGGQQKWSSTGNSKSWSEHNKSTDARISKLERFKGAESIFSLNGVTDFEKQSAVFNLLYNNLEEIRILLLEQASFYKQKQEEMIENKVSGEIARVWNEIIEEYIKTLKYLTEVTFTNNSSAVNDIRCALLSAQAGFNNFGSIQTKSKTT